MFLFFRYSLFFRKGNKKTTHHIIIINAKPVSMHLKYRKRQCRFLITHYLFKKNFELILWIRSCMSWCIWRVSVVSSGLCVLTLSLTHHHYFVKTGRTDWRTGIQCFVTVLFENQEYKEYHHNPSTFTQFSWDSHPIGLMDQTETFQNIFYEMI